MEEPLKEQPTPAVNSSGKPKLQRYALRSGSKLKEDKPPMADSSAPRRGRPASSVSKSLAVLDLSGKDKSARPPRRLSTPSKSSVNPLRKTTGSITPVSETGLKGSASRGKSETPVSDISRLSSRKKFNILASASYWLNQIKVSESVAKHNISLGFFKLALEAGCEPLQRLRDELKAYAGRHNLAEYGENVKQLFESYNISESFEQLQVSETCSQVPEDGTRSSDDDVRSTSSTVGTRKLKPKSLNIDAAQASSVTKLAKETGQKSTPAMRNRATINKNLATPKSIRTTAGPKSQKKVQKPNKEEAENVKHKTSGIKKLAASEGSINASATENANATKENKENEDAPLGEDITLTGLM